MATTDRPVASAVTLDHVVVLQARVEAREAHAHRTHHVRGSHVEQRDVAHRQHAMFAPRISNVYGTG